MSSTKLRTGPYTASAVCGLYFPAIQENLAESAQGEQGIWPIKSNSFGPLKQPSNRRLSFPFLSRSLPCRTACPFTLTVRKLASRRPAMAVPPAPVLAASLASIWRPRRRPRKGARRRARLIPRLVRCTCTARAAAFSRCAKEIEFSAPSIARCQLGLFPWFKER